MSCVINNFKKEYNLPEDANYIRIDRMEDGRKAGIKTYVEEANIKAQKEGYDKPLFEIDEKYRKAVSGHTYYRDNVVSSEYLKINEENVAEFEDLVAHNEYMEYVAVRDHLAEAEPSFSSFDEDQKASESLLSVQEQNESLYSYSVAPSQQLNLDPDNFYEWKQSLLNVKKNLENLAKKYTQLKDSKKLKEIYSTIEEIDTNLASIDETDPNNIYESSMNEIELLEDFLKTIWDDPKAGATALESNQLLERLGNLQRYFLAKNPDTGQAYGFKQLGDDLNPIAEFYFNFAEGLDPAKVDKLKSRIQDLEDLYNRTQVQIVKGLLHDDTMVQSLIQENKEDSTKGWSEEQVDEALKILEDGDIGIDVLSEMFLGAASGGGILGQLLKGVRDSQVAREMGQIQERVTALSDVWNTIKNLFEFDDKKTKEFIISKLFEKDEFGERKPSLIKRYTQAFYDSVKAVKSERGAFYADISEANYSSWMQADRDNFERIDPTKLSNIVDKYVTDPTFRKYFTSSTQEITDYQNRLREMLGETMYDIEIAKAEKRIEDYMEAVKDKSMTAQQEYRRNPFEFMKQYNSVDFSTQQVSRGRFLEPNFTHYVPKNRPELYNSNFTEVEQGEHGAELMEFYNQAHSLLVDYINPIFRSEGVSLNILDIMTFEDGYERNTIKSMTIVGKISKALGYLWNSHRKSFFDNVFLKQKQILESVQQETFKKDVQLGYVGYAKEQGKELAEILGTKSDKDLFKLAEKRGYDVENFPPPRKGEGYKRFRKRLIESLARAEVNENTSTNLFESIKNAAYLAADVRARRSTVATLEALKSFAESQSKRGAFYTNNTANTVGFLKSWGDSNIYGYRFSLDLNSEKGAEGLSGIGRKTLGVKHLNLTEKKIKSFLKEEKKALNNGKNVFNFTYEGVKYETSPDGIHSKVTDKKREIIDREDINGEKGVASIYGDYLTEKINELGYEATVGSVTLGVMGNIILSQLGVSARGGARNRLQGMIQNLAVASSERFGFDMEQYNHSRRLLRGTNTRKYIANKQFRSTERGKLIETVKLFQGSMQLLQNRADELAVEGKFDSVAGSALDKVKTFWMDFSMNNPEWHNQTELMLSILQTIPVKDKDGNSHMLYDGEKMEFIYEPGTLILKEKFDTPENRAMWTEFKESPEGKLDSLAAVIKIKTAVHQTQGNYDNTDIIMAQNNLVGKVSTMYQRYLFENLNMQWGQHKIDLRTGKFNVKGRKLVLVNHAPTTALYLAGVHGTQLVAGIIAGMGIVPLSIFVGGAAAFTIGVAAYRKSLNLKSLASSKDWGLALDFAEEAALRTINTPINTFSYGKLKGAGNERIKNLQSEERSKKRNLTQEERLILSESAQDVASKMFVWSTFTLSALLLQGLWALASATFGWDDDDEETVIGKFIDIEGKINALINDRNTLLSEIDKFSDPSAFQDEAISMSFFKTVNRARKFWLGTVPDVVMGEEEMSKDFAYKAIVNTLGVAKPNHLMKSILTDDKGMFSDNRTYEAKGVVDKFIYNNVKPTEKSANSQIREHRKKIKMEFESSYNSLLKKEYPNATKAERKVAIEIAFDKFIRATYKKPGQKYSDLLDRVNWDAFKKAAGNQTKIIR